MNVLDLFSGIGGFSLGLERAGMRTVAFCEIEPYPQQILSRHWPGIPIHEDIRQLDATRYAGTVDLVCGGYPCQPFSAAGKQQGEADPRHLWPEMHRIIREARPRWVVCENVRGHVSLGFDTVAAQLEDDGFTVWPFLVPACAVGAPHRRDRLWIVAHAARELLDGSGDAGKRRRIEPANSSQALADRQCEGLEGHTGYGGDRQEPGWLDSESNRSACEGGLRGAMADADCQPSFGPAIPRQECHPRDAKPAVRGMADGLSEGLFGIDQWRAEWPDVPRIASGIPNRVQRLKALGNSVVPQIPCLIGKAILAYEQQSSPTWPSNPTPVTISTGGAE